MVYQNGKANYDDIREMLDIDWVEMFEGNEDNVNGMWEIFEDEMEEAERKFPRK